MFIRRVKQENKMYRKEYLIKTYKTLIQLTKIAAAIPFFYASNPLILKDLA